MKLLPKILWKKRHRWQIVAAAAGSLIGLLLLLLAVQMGQDIKHLMRGDESGARQYLLINKQVNFLNTLGMKANFTEEEIEQLRSQDFIDEVGPFISNQYKVSASSRTLGFYTELFFESVPEAFIDIDPLAFRWEEGEEKLPIILSRDYLALYNFGFAPSQGLPQFTPGTISRVSVDITLRGKGRLQVFQGNIVGFSDRINSILVPQNFMEWANRNFGDNTQEEYSRLIIRTDNAYGQELQNFLANQAYEVSSGRLIGGELSALLSTIIALIGLIGLVIVLLSLLVFLLNFQLIISQASRDIGLLLELGYFHRQLSNLLITRVVVLFTIVFLGSLGLLWAIRYFMVDWFATQGLGLEASISGWVFLVGFLFSGFFLGLNILSIRKKVADLFV